MPHFDLSTLYVLVIGTLLVSAAMTLWERQARPQRSRELGILAAGYATLAIGCAAAMGRTYLPGLSGSALGNIVIVAGYLLILDGAAAMNGRRYRAVAAGMLAALILAWAIGGARWPNALWSYIGAVPIAVACGLTAWEVRRFDRAKLLRSRRLVMAVSGGHAIFYAIRASVLPLLAAFYGPAIVSIVGKATMYEGVLYSVALPMAVLTLIREEAQDRLLQVARTDYLTGIGNRQWFFEQGARLLRANSGQRPVSLLAFDLDHFKAINDRHGHAKGDEVLKSFACLARTVLGTEAFLARIGGEEFVALLPGHDGFRAREVGQAMAARFAEAFAGDDDGAGVKATVSIGVAESGPEWPDLASLLSAADRALYAAKALGRNRIELARPHALAAVA